MPAVVSSIFSLIPSPPASFFLGKKRHLSCWMRGTQEIVGQTRGMRSAEEEKGKENLKIKMDKREVTEEGKKNLYLDYEIWEVERV